MKANSGGFRPRLGVEDLGHPGGLNKASSNSLNNSESTPISSGTSSARLDTIGESFANPDRNEGVATTDRDLNRTLTGSPSKNFLRALVPVVGSETTRRVGS